MTYENMDWSAEAKRVARAFGIKRNCAFKLGSAPDSQVLSVNFRRFHNDAMLDNGAIFDVIYSSHTLLFGMERRVGKHVESAKIYLNWDGSLGQSQQGEPLSPSLAADLAKVLFHLDLLTPEVEKELGVTLSSEQKMAWESAYKTPYYFMNWELEARRVAAAFGLAGGPWKFKESGGERWLRPCQIAGETLWFEAVYSPELRYFHLEMPVEEPEPYVYIDWNGALIDDYEAHPQMSHFLAKGLFKLDLLTPEIEAALKVTTSAHQKAEWLGEYETNDL